MFRPNVVLAAASKVGSVQRSHIARIGVPAVFSRLYASLPREDVQTRVIEIVKSFDKVDSSKVNKR